MLSLVSLLAGFVIIPTTAHAAGPMHITLSGTQTGVDVCGITVTLSIKGVDNYSSVLDSSGNLIAFTDTHQERDTYTAANGRSVASSLAQHVTGTLTPNPDGTFTLLETFNGLAEKISTPNGPVLTRDAGLVSVEFVVDSSFNFLSGPTILVQAGPHPELDSGFTLFCQIVKPLLT
jgi:hypothetical protein